ncbi:VCBS repeat-containing protein [Aquimarina sp. AU474]|uniref:VCBS repeat-containing protein n=1 Tax=Aquimarina sp. AU474 TaxID=2108529 RepID=UPI001358ECB5|nr:VCBS repeat-containing protein [Aquimarina sp. AU474]
MTANKVNRTQRHLLLNSRILVLFFLMSFSFSCTDKEEIKPYPATLFEKIESKYSNITFKNNIYEDEFMNAFIYEYYYNGGGVAIGDINNDGLDDVYFTSNFEENHLYLNKGNLRFQNITKIANTKGGKGWTTGTNMIDINNDNLLDIYVCKSGPFRGSQMLENELYINKGLDQNGIPIFEESAKKYGINDSGYSIQSVFFDYDKDGDLDMYLMNHNPETLKPGTLTKGRLKQSQIGDKFYVNENGRYIDKTSETGIYSNEISYGLGLGVSDFNLDGWPDIYVSNDYEEHDYMYINKQDGTFKEVIKTATKHISNFSMGNDIADVDNDGFADILTLDMVSEHNYGIKTSMPSMNPEKFNQGVKEGRHFQYMYNTFQKHTTHIDSLGIPHYTEVGQIMGISNTDWSWAPLLADFDNDGRKDIFITNGIKRDFRNKDFHNKIQTFIRENADAFTNPKKIKHLISQTPNRPHKNYFFKNSGNLEFTNTSDTWVNNTIKGYSNGAAYSDLDNDGDLDLIINNVDQEATILRNNTNTISKNNFITIDFIGDQYNKKGIGAKIIVYSNKREQVYENYCVRGYQSSVPPKINVGLGKDEHIDSLKVFWPDGKVQKTKITALNRKYTINYFEDPDRVEEGSFKGSNTFFTAANLFPDITHVENKYDDYQHQILLPHKLSQFGPAIAVGDVNNDKIDDVFVGQSTGTSSALLIQKNNGEFIMHHVFNEDRKYEDIDAKFLDYDLDGDLDLYVASGGNEFIDNAFEYQDRLYENRSGKFIKRTDLLPSSIHSSSSKISIADFNKDGYPDIFIGGRHKPHQYPEPTSSYLLMNVNGKFENVTSQYIPELNDIGMVTDAVWSDYNNDGAIDLIIVGEWMSPTIFKNTTHGFEIVKSNLLNSLSGWYFSIKSQDLDNDGDPDYVLGNLGTNYKYKASKKEPLTLYYDDFDANGKQDIILGYYNFGALYPVRGKQCSSQQIPSLSKKIPTYHQFGNATVLDIYGKENLESAYTLLSYNFESGILENKGSGDFEFIPFPKMTQISSINDILIKDVNNDNKSDIIIAGNLYTSEIETPRNDAGFGMVMLNNGDLHFSSVPAHKSGLFIPYDSKSLEWITVKENTFLISGNNNNIISTYKLIEE